MRSASLTVGASMSWGSKVSGWGREMAADPGAARGGVDGERQVGLLGRERYRGGEYSSWVYMVDSNRPRGRGPLPMSVEPGV